MFTDKILEHMHTCIPYKEVIIRPDDKPWYDSEIRKYSRNRDRTKALATKSNRAQDWAKYKQLRNKVNNLKKHAKEKFFNNIETIVSDSRTNNPRQYWKLIRHLVKSNKNSEIIPPLKSTLEDGSEVYNYSDSDKANCLNDFFASISRVNDTNANLPEFIPKTLNHLTDISILESEIIDIISVLNANKAVGEDLISHKILINTKHTISKPLCKLFNKSLNEGVFPSNWKSALVMPFIQKKEVLLQRQIIDRFPF